MSKLWGGRFSRSLDPSAKNFSYSLRVDQELFAYDIQSTIAHIKMLSKVGIVKSAEAQKLVTSLQGIQKTYGKRSLDAFAEKHEDVHSFIYAELEKRAGALAKKAYSGRSRNDQVVTATRLYLKDHLTDVMKRITRFQKVMVRLASKNQDVVIPGYTHLQRAQVVLIAHHVLAYVEMLERDKSRIEHARKTCDELPLGSGALGGSSLPLNREMVRLALGFKSTSRNSLDAVSSRDFILEALAAISILMVHLSRLSEDIILWNSSEFNYVTLRDDFATGSSLMPHKKNPDFFELTRGKSGEAIGNLMAGLVLLKGLPLSYNRDLQEDKPPLFQSVRMIQATLETLAGALETLTINREACREAVTDSFLYATDLLDYLIEKGTAFKDAHDQVGQLVNYSVSRGQDLRHLTLSEYKRFLPQAREDVYQLFSATSSVKKKKTAGSTSPASVKKQIAYWNKILK